MKAAIYKRILRWLGWSISGKFDPEISKSVIIVAPHTSWYDFILGLLARGIIGLEMHFVGKKELFVFPFAYYFSWMGGEPLDRRGGLNTVNSIVTIFQRRDVFRLAIAPEGTRRSVKEWKSGFYYIALGANVPVIPVVFDYGSRQIVLHDAIYPTGDYTGDVAFLRSLYRGARGRNLQSDYQ